METAHAAFQYLCAYDFSGPGRNLSGDSLPEQVKGIHVSADFFSVFDARPAAGRVFSADEDLPGGPRVAVMSHAASWIPARRATRIDLVLALRCE